MEGYHLSITIPSISIKNPEFNAGRKSSRRNRQEFLRFHSCSQGLMLEEVGLRTRIESLVVKGVDWIALTSSIVMI
jgi:hypothetical protein